MDTAQKIMHIHYEAARRGVLSAWTVYDHPNPDVYVARRFEYDDPTNDVVITKDLEGLRRTFQRAGLVCMMRNENDDPKIMETWL